MLNRYKLNRLLKMLDECISAGRMHSDNSDEFDDSFLLPYLNFPGTYHERLQQVAAYRSTVVRQFRNHDHSTIWEPPNFTAIEVSI